MKSNFSRMPSVSISRSKFLRKSQHKTSFKLGELIPIYLDEVLPGDTRKIDVGSLIRMSTPVAPVMDNIYLDIYAFFVPNRLTWVHWKEFMGENNSSAGIYTGTAYTIPMIDIAGSQNMGSVLSGGLGDHLGLPLTTYAANKTLRVSVLPVRAYRLIYNRFFRDQNVIAPLTVNTGDTPNYHDIFNTPCEKVAKVSDYFTRSLPYAQKGAPVSIPLGTTAPVNIVNTTTSSISQNTTLGSPALAANGSSSNMWASGNMLKLQADLSTATAATINQLRFAFQYQKLLEKDALYGTRLH